MKNRKLIVTIDTEMDADIHWRRVQPPEFTSVLEGIPDMLRPIWDKYQVDPVYFVSPEVVKDPACCAVLKNEIQKGAVIGAHLHPEYIEPYTKETANSGQNEWPCYDYSSDEEKEKIKNLIWLIEKNLGVRPVWYRAARFGADLESIKILMELGLRYDSSVTPFIDWSKKGGPDHSRAPMFAYEISKSDYYKSGRGETGIVEYPVTIRGKRLGILNKLLSDNWLFYRWLRPTHMTYWELRSMIRKCAKVPEDLVMMFHSMEIMVNKTPYVRNRWMQKYYLWRLGRTLRYARLKGYCMHGIDR